MGGGQKGKRGADPPIQKGSGSITKKKPEAKAADGAAKPRKQKAAKGTRELPDDDMARKQATSVHSSLLRSVPIWSKRCRPHSRPHTYTRNLATYPIRLISA